MIRGLIIKPAARRELLNAYFWYEDQRVGLGEEFANEVDEYFGKIKEHPTLYPKILNKIRRARMDRFKFYSIIFEVDRHTIVVHSIFHARRNPNEWKKRL